MNTAIYNDIIVDAYINPIRSALMIDDKYPTYKSFLEGNSDVDGENKPFLQKLCKLCEKNKWTFHVEKDIPEEYLNEPSVISKSDIIFLDFKLKGEISEGKKAIDTIRYLATAERFNLVVVYTLEDIRKTFSQIVYSTASIDFKISGNFEDILLDLESDYSGISERIKNAVDQLFFEYVLDNEHGTKIIEEKVQSIFREFKINDEEKCSCCVCWGIAQIIQKYKVASPLSVERKIDLSTNTNWIKINNVFITVIRKDLTSNILQQIQDAVCFWHPTLGQLILRDAKNQLDKHCFCDSFSPAKQEAAWFFFSYIKGMLGPNEILSNLLGEVQHKIKNRYHDRIKTIIDSSSDKIQDFYSGYDAGENNINLYHDINFFRSMLPTPDIETGHLQTGMLLSMPNNGLKEYWLCLMQSCDLEPEQQSLSWVLPAGKDYKYKPVILVRLDICDNSKIKKTLTQATRGNYIFFMDGDIRLAGYLYSKDNDPEKNIKPHYEVFIAPDRARFNHHRIELYRLTYEDAQPQLRICNTEFFVIGQMRYEYACQLLAKLSAHMSRIGIDYIPYSNS